MRLIAIAALAASTFITSTLVGYVPANAGARGVSSVLPLPLIGDGSSEASTIGPTNTLSHKMTPPDLTLFVQIKSSNAGCGLTLHGPS
jgi:hypothetical protein